jgi:hypothetical protein
MTNKKNKSNIECEFFTTLSVCLLPHDYIFLRRKIRFNHSSLFKRYLLNSIQLEWLFVLIFISTSARSFVVRFLFSFHKDCMWLKIDLRYTFETDTERDNEVNFYELEKFSPSRRYAQILPSLTIKALFFL